MSHVEPQRKLRLQPLFDRVMSAARLAKFATVGVSGAIVYYVLVYLMVEIGRVPVLIATSLGFAFVTLENYALHYLWTFGSSSPHMVTLPRFACMSIAGFSINWGIMFTGTEKLRLNYLCVQAVAILVVVIWNILLSNLWIFDSRDDAGSRVDQ